MIQGAGRRAGNSMGLLKGMRDKNSIQQGPFKFLAWAKGNAMTVFIAHWWVGCEWNSKGSWALCRQRINMRTPGPPLGHNVFPLVFIFSQLKARLSFPSSDCVQESSLLVTLCQHVLNDSG